MLMVIFMEIILLMMHLIVKDFNNNLVVVWMCLKYSQVFIKRKIYFKYYLFYLIKG
jgi:hypothetical protein